MKNRLLGIFVFMMNGCGPPTDDWVPVESAVYHEPGKVKLTRPDILQLHRVRCVVNTSKYTEFQSMCSFEPPGQDSVGIVTDGWVTKDPVEAGEWHWEVELKSGES